MLQNVLKKEFSVLRKDKYQLNSLKASKLAGKQLNIMGFSSRLNSYKIEMYI